MGTFLGIHDMGGAVADDMVTQNWEKYKAACVKAGLSPKHAHANAAQGKAFCVTEASSADLVQKAHDDAGVPVNEIIEVRELS